MHKRRTKICDSVSVIRGCENWDVKLTIHLQLVLRSRMQGIICLLPQYTFMM